MTPKYHTFLKCYTGKIYYFKHIICYIFRSPKFGLSSLHFYSSFNHSFQFFFRKLLNEKWSKFDETLKFDKNGENLTKNGQNLTKNGNSTQVVKSWRKLEIRQKWSKLDENWKFDKNRQNLTKFSLSFVNFLQIIRCSNFAVKYGTKAC